MSIRSLQDESVSDRLRKAQVAQIFFVLPFLLLISVFFRYQVLHTSEYQLHSEENRLRRIELPPPRGLILDRNGAVLAENIPAYSLEIYPLPVDSMTILLHRLAPLLDLDPEQQEQLIEDFRRHRTTPLKVSGNIDQKTLAVVEEHRNELPNIHLRSDMKRHYVLGEAVAHVLGYVGEINDREMEQERYKDYSMGSLIGRSGIESQYEHDLHGRQGIKFVEVDVRGRELGPFQDRPPLLPEPGKDLQLTIDSRLQQAMASIMDTVAIGAMVAMDPNSGEILAMVSRPSFDPNNLSAGISSRELRQLLFHPDKPFLNRTIQGVYPPGSTFKVFTAMAGAELGYIHPDYSGLEVVCRGGLQYGRRFFKCWESGGHGRVNLFSAIVLSCDTFFYQLGIKIGLDKFCEMGRQSGIFDKTGIDLPNEERGLIPDESWYNRTHGKGNWGPGNVLNLSIGQGEISMTPLEIASLYAAVATGGKRYRPHLVRGDIRQFRLPDLMFQPENIRMLMAPLSGVINDESRGTARGSRLFGHELHMGGKTGTAQNPHGEDHGLFVGIYPMEAPEIVVSIVIEFGGHGSATARLVRDLVLEYIRLKDLDNQKSLAAATSTAPDTLADTSPAQPQPTVEPSHQVAPAATPATDSLTTGTR